MVTLYFFNFGADAAFEMLGTTEVSKRAITGINTLLIFMAKRIAKAPRCSSVGLQLP